MRNAFEQSINNVNGAEQGEDDEKGAMVCIKVRLVIDRLIGRPFPREEQRSEARYKIVGEIKTKTKSKKAHVCWLRHR